MVIHGTQITKKSGDDLPLRCTRLQKGHSSPYQFKSSNQNSILKIEARFNPQIGKHVARLITIPSLIQRQDLLMQQQKAYGNRYIRQLIVSDVAIVGGRKHEEPDRNMSPANADNWLPTKNKTEYTRGHCHDK